MAQSIKVTKSCGCGGRSFKYRSHPLYNKFCKIIGRCENPKGLSYPSYGGRGIKICQGFRQSFELFVSKIGAPPTKIHTLDRKDNEGHYSCGECSECLKNNWLFNLRWATPSQQASNRRTTVLVELEGVKMSMKDACRKLGLNYKVLHQNINRDKMTFEQAVAFRLYKKKIDKT